MRRGKGKGQPPDHAPRGVQCGNRKKNSAHKHIHFTTWQKHDMTCNREGGGERGGWRVWGAREVSVTGGRYLGSTRLCVIRASVSPLWRLRDGKFQPSGSDFPDRLWGLGLSIHQCYGQDRLFYIKPNETDYFTSSQTRMKGPFYLSMWQVYSKYAWPVLPASLGLKVERLQ